MVESYEKCKGWLEVGRDAMILMIFGMLLIFPGCVNESLKKAGFTTGNVAGFEWHSAAESALEEAKEATTNIASIEKQLEETRLVLAKVQAAPALPPTTQSEISKLNTKIGKTSSETSVTRDKLQKSIVTQQKLINQMRNK